MVFVLFMPSLFSETYYVRFDGNNANDGLSPENAWQTIAYAASQAIESGSTIYIAAGEYNDAPVISHSGTSGNPITYFGDKTGEYFGAFASSGNVYINGNGFSKAITVDSESNLVFKNLKMRFTDHSGIYIYNSDNISVIDCEIDNCGQFGIFHANSSGTFTFRGNQISNETFAGIYSTNITENSLVNITENNISICGTGIYLFMSIAESINSNTISNVNQEGIAIQNSFPIGQISNNNLSLINSGNAIYVDKSNVKKINSNIIERVLSNGIYCNSSDNIDEISYNSIHTVDINHGIHCNQTNVSDMNYNTIANVMKCGIYVFSTTEINIRNVSYNNIRDCEQDGIYLNNFKSFGNIAQNTISNTFNGISLRNGKKDSNYLISENAISDFLEGAGIYVDNVRNLVIRNNLIYNSSRIWSSRGIYINNNGNNPLDIINNTLYKTGLAGIYGKNVTGIWKNNIIAGHSNSGFFGLQVQNSTPLLSYNCLYDNHTHYSGIAEGTNSLSADPMFVNAAGGDFHIKSIYGSYHNGAWTKDDASSPCLDAGDPNDSYSSEPPINGGRINIGAYGNTNQASLSGDPNAPVVETHQYVIPESTWVLIGPPVMPQNTNPMAVYGDDFGGEAPFDNDHWSFIRWRTEDEVSEYYEYGDGTPYQPENPRPGLGHFLWQDYGDPVVLDVTGEPVTEDMLLNIAPAPEADWDPPAPGFNMFANPFNFAMDWSNTSVRYNGVDYPLWIAFILPYVSVYAYTWNHNSSQYELVAPNYFNHTDKIKTWQGFWFVQRTSSPETFRLKIPYQPNAIPKSTSQEEILIESIYTIDPKFNIKPASTFSEWEWFLKLSVFSEDNLLSDTENGIGVYENALDQEDGWDAFEFDSQNDDYISLYFLHENGRKFTYDLHGDFETESEWNFKITTNQENRGKNFKILWPFLNTVPGNLRFSLKNETGETLVEDLGAISSYTFNLDEVHKSFILTAQKIADTTPPECRFMYTQNFLIPKDMTLFIIPVEPVSSISARLNNQEIEVSKISQNSNIYYHKYFLPDYGSLAIDVDLIDYAGNTRSHSTTISLTKVTGPEQAILQSGSVVFKLPANSLDRTVSLTLTAEALDITPNETMEPLSQPIKIGPSNIQFLQKAKLFFGTRQPAFLYHYKNNRWSFVRSGTDHFPIEETGIYQLFKNPVPDETSRPDISKDFHIESVYPNPFNAETTIRFSLTDLAKIQIFVYNLKGQKVRAIFDGIANQGYHQVSWNGTDENRQHLASGTYFLRFESETQSGRNIMMKKITYLK